MSLTHIDFYERLRAGAFNISEETVKAIEDFAKEVDGKAKFRTAHDGTVMEVNLELYFGDLFRVFEAHTSNSNARVTIHTGKEAAYWSGGKDAWSITKDFKTMEEACVSAIKVSRSIMQIDWGDGFESLW